MVISSKIAIYHPEYYSKILATEVPNVYHENTTNYFRVYIQQSTFCCDGQNCDAVATDQKILNGISYYLYIGTTSI
jgi:hypothetical protein